MLHRRPDAPIGRLHALAIHEIAQKIKQHPCNKGSVCRIENNRSGRNIENRLEANRTLYLAPAYKHAANQNQIGRYEQNKNCRQQPTDLCKMISCQPQGFFRLSI
jgi:hypothetical protein